jgi:hypothetical protein
VCSATRWILARRLLAVPTVSAPKLLRSRRKHDTGRDQRPVRSGVHVDAAKTNAYTTLSWQLITSNPMVCSPLREMGQVLRRNDTKV